MNTKDLTTFRILALSLLAIFSCSLVGCSDKKAGTINCASEEFEYSFIPTETGGQVVYSGKNHFFTFAISGHKVNSLDFLNADKSGNMRFIKADSITWQSAIIEIPPEVRKHYNFANLDTTSMQELLSQYINYELDYITNELDFKVDFPGIKWEKIKGAPYAFWYVAYPFDSIQGNSPIGQIHLSGVCFNQILTLSCPVFDDGTTMQELNDRLCVLGRGVAQYNRPFKPTDKKLFKAVNRKPDYSEMIPVDLREKPL